MRKTVIVFLVIVFFSLHQKVSAHPGGTDASGCHRCLSCSPYGNLYEWGGRLYEYYHCYKPDISPDNSANPDSTVEDLLNDLHIRDEIPPVVVPPRNDPTPNPELEYWKQRLQAAQEESDRLEQKRQQKQKEKEEYNRKLEEEINRKLNRLLTPKPTFKIIEPNEPKKRPTPTPTPTPTPAKLPEPTPYLAGSILGDTDVNQVKRIQTEKHGLQVWFWTLWNNFVKIFKT